MPSAKIAATVGAKVRAGRTQLGLTRKQFAAKAAVSERYLNELENGASNASITILAKVAAALGETPAGLMGATLPASVQSMTKDLQSVLATMTAIEQQALAPVAAKWLADYRRGSKGIALVGLRGAGKSSLGKRLAARYGVPLISVTREIEQRAGMNLQDLFNLGGPDAYRAMERDVIIDLVAGDSRIVLETAGGIAGNPEMMALILAHFKTVWLKASPEEHLARVARQGDSRPTRGNPAALEHLKALITARAPEYARADVTIDTSGRTLEACFADLDKVAASALQRPS